MGTVKQRNRWLFYATALMLAAGIIAEGSSCGGTENTGTQATSAGSSGRGGAGGDLFGSSSGMGGTVDCAVPCDAMTQVCSHGTCVPKAPCKTDNDCQNDTKCDPTVGCVPWEGQTPAHDPGCINV